MSTMFKSKLGLGTKLGSGINSNATDLSVRLELAGLTVSITIDIAWSFLP